MTNLPPNLLEKIQFRIDNQLLRQLPASENLVDFSSNDYLGFAKNERLFDAAHQLLIDRKIKINGATGSRLLSGNHSLYQEAEIFIANFHQSETALIFNSGYDANIGFFSSVPQRNDIILYDELCHASIRDGIVISLANSYKFKHNDLEDLENKILKNKSQKIENTAAKTQQSFSIYVVTESVFSMDGDTPNLNELVALCSKFNCYIIVDEAHALGVFGDKGEGIVQDLKLQNKIFARIITFGKGLGCHGAAILCNQELKEYLINFARSFIYTTGLSPHCLATIITAYTFLEKEINETAKLRENINFYNQQKQILGLKPIFVRSKSAIQSAIIPGNERIKFIATQFQKEGFDVKAIRSPTVPQGQERLRFCIHSYNAVNEIINSLNFLKNFI
jgi:8-amino-7-oxononanoate synthase